MPCMLYSAVLSSFIPMVVMEFILCLGAFFFFFLSRCVPDWCQMLWLSAYGASEVDCLPSVLIHF